MGTAFIVQDKNVYYLLTNTHVLKEPGGGVVSEAQIFFSGETRGVITAKVEAVRENADVALLWMSVVGKAVPALPLRQERPKDGTPVVACGFPLGDTFQLGDTHPEPTLNAGSILQAQAQPPAVYKGGTIMKADVSINPGNSGGPVVDLDGAVVGLVVAGYLGSETSFVIPVEVATQLLREKGVRFSRATGSSPEQAPAATQAPLPPPSAREALNASTVVVRTGEKENIGVVLQAPEHRGVLVLTQAGQLMARLPVQVQFPRPGAEAPVSRPGTVLYTESETGLALVELEDFDGRPPGLPLGDSSGLKETELLWLGGGRKTGEVFMPMNRTAILTGIEQARRWELGPQEPAMLRVDAGIGSSILPGPALDAQGRLAGFVTQHVWKTNITVLAAAEQLRELLAGRPRSLAARARRDGTGGCHVDFFVDAETPLSLPRTVELALDQPALSMEDRLEPRFGPDTALGTLEGRNRLFHLERPSCPETSLTYRVKLTSALKTQELEGVLPLPLLPSDRTQQLFPLPRLTQPNKALTGFLRWEDDEAARPAAPVELEEALTQCRAYAPACAQAVTRATGPARARTQKVLLAACLQQKEAPACLGVADLLGASTPARALPPEEALGALDQGCKAGLLLACERLGGWLLDRGLWPEQVRAVDVLRKSCELGSGPGCAMLGYAASDGRGMPRDEATSLRMYRRACRLNDSDACLNAGAMHLRRRSTWGDTEASYEAFRRGCSLGAQKACLEMTRTGSRGASAGYTAQQE